VRLEQTSPGRYETKFPTREVGSYSLNLMELKEGKVSGFQSIGASVNYSPEFTAPEPNLNLLARLAEAGGGKLLDTLTPEMLAGTIPMESNPFLHDRRKTFQPRDWWEWLLKLAVILFVFDVAVRRIQIERDQWQKFLGRVQQTIFFWKGVPRPVEADLSLAALLSRRDEVRSRQTAPAVEARPELFKPAQPFILPARPSRDEPEPPAPDPREVGPETPEPRPATTTSRLLEAKRKARKKID